MLYPIELWPRVLRRCATARRSRQDPCLSTSYSPLSTGCCYSGPAHGRVFVAMSNGQKQKQRQKQRETRAEPELARAPFFVLRTPLLPFDEWLSFGSELEAP